MMRFASALLAACFACLEINDATAQTLAEHNSKRIAELHVGIFCKFDETLSAGAAPNTIKGTVENFDSSLALVEETQTIPAVDRLYFGVLGREKTENGTITIKVTHPPLGPEGTTVESWETKMSTSELTMHAYYFGLSDGDPVGRWTITGKSGGTKLFYVEFDVVPADAKPDPCLVKPVS